MGSEIQQDNTIMSLLENTVMQILRKNGMLQGNKTFGVVAEIINDTKVMVDMTQSSSVELVSCSPNVEMALGDRVLVEYINNNPHDMFVIAVIAKGTGGDVIEDKIVSCECLPTEPVEIIREDEEPERAYLFIYAYDSEYRWEQELIRDERGKVIEIIHRYPNHIILVRRLYRDEKDRVYKYE